MIQRKQSLWLFIAADELLAILSRECERVNALKVCKVEYSLNDTGFKLSNTIKNFILRIIQEFMQNSLKHADCKNICLFFNYSDKGLTISASDDGSGFDVNRYIGEDKKGIGLLNMKKRAELIGADFSIRSSKNAGTVLQLFIPLNKLYA